MAVLFQKLNGSDIMVCISTKDLWLNGAFIVCCSQVLAPVPTVLAVLTYGKIKRLLVKRDGCVQPSDSVEHRKLLTRARAAAAGACASRLQRPGSVN